MMCPAEPESKRIVIAGGGAAALEAMLALREMAGANAEIEMFAPRSDFVMRPLAVTEAFGTGEVLKYDLGELAKDSGATFHQRSIISVEPENRRVILHEGEEVDYDYLVVATGTKSLWVVPGASTFWGPDSQEAINRVLDLIREGTPSKVVLTMPDRAGWPLPIYELAMFLAGEIRDHKSPTQLVIASPEKSPMHGFGPRVSECVSDLLRQHHISFMPEKVPISYGDGSLTTSPFETIRADAAITLPRLTGRRIGGLPFNDDGFIPVDDIGLISGMDREFAAGDVMSYPFKFGGFATGQADVVAAAIASRAWGLPEPEPFKPDLRATLLTPDGPVFLGEDQDWSDLDQEVASEGWNPSRKIRGKFLTPVLARAVAK